jgi:Zn-dependent membrane protease YugP
LFSLSKDQDGGQFCLRSVAGTAVTSHEVGLLSRVL